MVTLLDLAAQIWRLCAFAMHLKTCVFHLYRVFGVVRIG